MNAFSIKLPETITNASSVIDLSPWAGTGIDDVVTGLVQAFREVLADELASPATVRSNVLAVRRSLLPWLQRRAELSGRIFQLDMIDDELVQEFIDHLKAERSYTSAQANYYGVAFALRQMANIGLIKNPSAIFPFNPFPGGQSTQQTTCPYTASERKAIFCALSADYREIAEGHFGKSEAEQASAIVICLLLMAFLTGLNLTPLLELSRRALQPHPVKSGAHVLVAYKRRGNKWIAVPLKTIPIVRNPRFDVAEIFLTIERLTEPLVSEVKAKYRDCLFLRYGGRGKKGLATTVSVHFASRIARKLSETYAIQGDDGAVLRIGTRRIRATLAARVAELSDNDPFVVARVLGNLSRTASIHYMAPDLDAPAGFQSAVEAFVKRLQDPGEVLPIPTPVGSCSDPLHGRFAPKDGVNFCQRWLLCFRCPNQCLVGDEENLWRAYSFYWALQVRYQSLQRTSASGLVRFAIHVMDAVLVEEFGSKARKARDRARYDPHPFWRIVRERQLLDLVVPDANN